MTAGWFQWPDEQTGPYTLRLFFDEVDGRPACVGLEIWGVTPETAAVPEGDWRRVMELAKKIRAGIRKSGRRNPTLTDELIAQVERIATHRPRPNPALDGRTEVTAEAIRIPLRQIAQGQLDKIRPTVLGWQAVDGDRLAQLTRPLGYVTEPERRLGRPTEYDQDHWAQVAATWLSAWRGGSDRPTSDLADAYVVSKSTAAKWVALCRRRGLLPPSAGKGRAAPSKINDDSARPGKAQRQRRGQVDAPRVTPHGGRSL